MRNRKLLWFYLEIEVFLAKKDPVLTKLGKI